MKFFFVAIAFLVALFIVKEVHERNMTISKESGLVREGAHDATKQSQEDRSIWETQRENRNKVPRE